MFHESNFTAQANRFRKKYGIESTLHQLRHYYATALWESGFAPDEAQLLLRHARLEMTMDTYREIREGRKMDAVFDRVRYGMNIENPVSLLKN